jgi:tRNA modification GTPase
VVNKTDLIDAPKSITIPERFSKYPTFFVSAKLGTGIQALTAAIKEKVLGGGGIDPQRTLVPTLRQKISLEAARDALKNARSAMDPWVGEELILMDFEAAKKELDEIIGNTHDSDILDEIFGKFCIGK